MKCSFLDMPPPRESIVFGCPYCIGPIYFTLSDYEKHWCEQHAEKKSFQEIAN